LLDKIRKIIDSIKLNEPMSKHTSFGIGGPADVFAVAEDEESLKRLTQILEDNGIDYFLLGGGTNILVNDKGIRGVAIRLGRGFEKVERVENGLAVGAAAKLVKVVDKAQREGLSGLEFASGIPGTTGGALMVNASAFGHLIRPLARRIRRLKGSKIILEAELELRREDPSVIVSKMREYFEYKRETQPLFLKSAGCVFRNPPNRFAGQLIQEAGLKGERVGGAYVSFKHANFIINRGDAKATDVLNLMELIQEKVKGLFGILLEPEINIIGETFP